MSAGPTSVLFVCTHNAIRSPMAEAMLKRRLGRSVFIQSAGVRSGDLDPFAVAVMKELDIDLAAHQPKSFDELEDDFFDLVVTLSPEAHHRALELTRTAACVVQYWPVMDPTIVEGSREVRLDAFRQARDAICRRLEKLLAPAGELEGVRAADQGTAGAAESGV